MHEKFKFGNKKAKKVNKSIKEMIEQNNRKAEDFAKAIEECEKTVRLLLKLFLSLFCCRYLSQVIFHLT